MDLLWRLELAGAGSREKGVIALEAAKATVKLLSAPEGAQQFSPGSECYLAAASTSASFLASTASSTAYSASSMAACANWMAS